MTRAVSYIVLGGTEHIEWKTGLILPAPFSDPGSGPGHEEKGAKTSALRVSSHFMSRSPIRLGVMAPADGGLL
jgi:hypothetical protein